VLRQPGQSRAAHSRRARCVDAAGAKNAWPPPFLDVGFLLIGHVDEIVHFLPVGDETRVLVVE
jgi:hypothetical protein